jgi:hypothetical protein
VTDHQDADTGNPIVDLIDSNSVRDVRTTRVRVRGDLPADPIAPASLIGLDPRRVVIELHRVVGTFGREIVFETYGDTSTPPRDSYVLEGWWMPDGFALVADTSRVWIRASYPGDHESAFPALGPHFCFLTYEQLVPGEPAYTDGRGAWVSVSGYEKYIAGDLLRLRIKPAAG